VDAEEDTILAPGDVIEVKLAVDFPSPLFGEHNTN
jgi:hypothetical protein